MDTQALVQLVAEEVARRLREGDREHLVPVAVSNRHIHLSAADHQSLFAGRPLTKLRDLSQPGEFAANETVTIVGPKGVIEGVRILAPIRRATQIELSRTDSFRLGIDPPVRESGNHEGSAGLAVVGPAGTVMLRQGVIIAMRHIHMTPEDAARFGVQDQQVVSVHRGGERAITLGNVLIRVSPRYRLELHIDTDEANAGLFDNGDLVALTCGAVVATGRGDLVTAPPPAPRDATSYSGRLLTESDVLALARQGLTTLTLAPGTLVTPLAADAARQHGLHLHRR